MSCGWEASTARYSVEVVGSSGKRGDGTSHRHSSCNVKVRRDVLVVMVDSYGLLLVAWRWLRGDGFRMVYIDGVVGMLQPR